MTKLIILTLSLIIAGPALAEKCDKCCDLRAKQANAHVSYLDHVDACRGDKTAPHCAYVAKKRKEYEDAKKKADAACEDKTP